MSRERLSQFNRQEAEFLLKNLVTLYFQLMEATIDYRLLNTKDSMYIAETYTRQALESFCKRHHITYEFAEKILGINGKRIDSGDRPKDKYYDIFLKKIDE